MNSTTVQNISVVEDRARARTAVVPVAVITFLVFTFLNVARADSGGEALGVTVFDLVILALVFGLAVPRGLRTEQVGWTGVVLGALGLVVVVPAFWSGLPMILGAAALLLGYAGRRGSQGSGRATAALVLGALAVIGYLAVYAADWIAKPGASWWS